MRSFLSIFGIIISLLLFYTGICLGQEPRFPEKPPQHEHMQEIRREIEELKKMAEMARKKGQREKLEMAMQKIRQLENKLQDMERRVRPPKPGMPPLEGPPPHEPRKAEELRRRLHEIEMKMAEAKKRKDLKLLEKLKRESEDISRMLEEFDRHRQPERELSEEEIDKVIEWLEKHEPETLEKLEQFREREPEAFYHFLREMFEKMQRMEEMRERDPQGYERMMETRKLEKQVWEQVEKYKHSMKPEDKKAIEAKLEEILSRLFDLKQAQHKAEIEQLEKEVTKLKEMYQKNLEHKKEIIQERVKELTGKKRPFDW